MELRVYPIVNGLMCYWDAVEEASRYHANLYIDDVQIKTMTMDRHTLICTFEGLVPIHLYGHKDNPYKCSRYHIQVEAEGGHGEIIAKSRMLCMDVLSN